MRDKVKKRNCKMIERMRGRRRRIKGRRGEEEKGKEEEEEKEVRCCVRPCFVRS